MLCYARRRSPGNEAARQLIRSWAPHTTAVATGVVLINNPENMRRFVRARILLEEANTGCIASFDDSLSVVRVIHASRRLPAPACRPLRTGVHLAHTLGRSAVQVICRFSRSEHQLLLPLWPGAGEVDQTKTLANLRRWHREQFADGARLSGKHIESPEDQAAWNGGA